MLKTHPLQALLKCKPVSELTTGDSGILFQHPDEVNFIRFCPCGDPFYLDAMLFTCGYVSNGGVVLEDIGVFV